MAGTMIEAGLAFLAAQLVLAILVWKFSSRPKDAKITAIPGGATGIVAPAFILVGVQVLALGVMGQSAWAAVYFTASAPTALPVPVQSGPFALYFGYPAP